MADPFASLRLPLSDVSPDPAFATRLRSRLERALALPEGVTVSHLVLDPTTDRGHDAPAATTGGVVPYLIVADARRALAWYVTALGAATRGEPIVMPDGRIGHAEFVLSGSALYVADEASGNSAVAAPRPGAGATVSLTVEVRDVDAAVARAVAEGAELERPAADNPYGRNAVIRDPFGHRWIVSASPVPPNTPTAPGFDLVRHGDVGYVSLWVRDEERAAAFFSAVLGWTYEDPAGASHQVMGSELRHGVNGGHDRSTLFLCFVVDDMASARDRIRAAGGEAEPATAEPWGQTAVCRDVEGTPFAVYEAPPGARPRRLPANGRHGGDVSYITMEVKDSAAVRAFYGAVLGWEFSPGRVADGWGAIDVVPMTGLHGGHDRTTILPMYRVDDIEAAVARVRAAGGSATEPETHPYGRSAECTDDQGTRFYLGQH